MNTKAITDGCALTDLGGGSFRLFSEKSGGAAIFEELPDADLQTAKFLNFDITNECENSICFAVHFLRKGGGEPLHMSIGLLPRVKTQISMPLSALDSQNIFLRTTPGKLKTTLGGKPLAISELAGISLKMERIPEPCGVVVENLCLSETEQEYIIPDIILADEIGQAAVKDWAGKTKNAEDMAAYLKAEAEKPCAEWQGLSEYGGWLKKRFKATGYFRTEKEGGRWWLVDPLGYAFISAGLDCVSPDGMGRTAGIEKFYKWLPDKEDEKFKDAWGFRGRRAGQGSRPDLAMFSFSVANLIRAFGEDWFENWAKITKSRLKEWGFNTIANWSNRQFTEYVKIPYVWPLAGFPSTEKKIFRDFPDVFSDEYRRNSAVFAKQLEPMKDDPYLIGYFLSNEPHWAFGDSLNVAEELLSTDFDTAAKAEFIKHIQGRYDTIADLNAAWQTEFASFSDLKTPMKNAREKSEAARKDITDFSVMMVREYIAVPSKALRTVDPNHLNLGIRYAWFSGEALLGGIEYFDVFSFNCYANDPTSSLAGFAKVVNLPLMIGEYHHGALDAGMWATGIGGVTTQKERGKAYRYYTERAFAFKQCVGAHYFILNDQPLLGRFDGENYQIGCVDVCHKPYADFIEGIKATTSVMYEIAAGEKAVFDEPIEYTERIFF